jgi:ribonuclease HI
VGWIKLNTDAGCRLYSGEASSVVVVRDENGDVLLLAWKPLRFFVAEAEACLHGLKLVATRFRKPACVESDCAVLIKAINEKEEDRSKWAGIIKEIQSFRPCSQAACLAIQSAKPIRWCMH